MKLFKYTEKELMLFLLAVIMPHLKKLFLTLILTLVILGERAGL